MSNDSGAYTQDLTDLWTNEQFENGAAYRMNRYWQPSAHLTKAIKDYERIKSDYDRFDGDARSIAYALLEAEANVLRAVLIVQGDDGDNPNATLITACADLVLQVIRNTEEER